MTCRERAAQIIEVIQIIHAIQIIQDAKVQEERNAKTDV